MIDMIRMQGYSKQYKDTHHEAILNAIASNTISHMERWKAKHKEHNKPIIINGYDCRLR